MADWKDVGDEGGWSDVGWEDVGAKKVDLARQIPGLEHTVDPSKPPEKEYSFLEAMQRAVGEIPNALRTAASFAPTLMDPSGKTDSPESRALKESAAMLGTGAAAQVAAPFVGGANYLKDRAMGQEGQTFEQEYFGAMDRLTAHPKSDLGQDWGENIGQAITAVGNPMMGHVGNLGVAPYGRTPKTVKPVMSEMVPSPEGPVNPGTTVEMGLRTKAESRARPDQKIAQLFEEEAAKEASSSSAVDRPQQLAEAQRGVETDIARLRDQDIIGGLKALDRELSAKEDVAALKATEAQKTLEERQTQLEFETKRQATLDFNAAERARQEKAPVPGLAERAAEVERAQAEVNRAFQEAKMGELGRATKQSGSMLMDMSEKVDTLSRLVQEGVLKPLGDSLQGVKVYRAVADGEALQGPRKAGSWVTPNRDIALNVYAKGDHTRVVEDYIPKRDLYEAHPDGWVYAPKGTDISGVKRTDALTFGEMANKANSPWAGFPEGKTVRSPGNKQKGAMLISPKKKNEAGILSSIEGIKKALPTFVFKDTTPADVIAMAKGAKDLDQNGLQKALNLFTKGGQFMAEKVKNPVVNFVVDRINRQDRLARADIRDYVHDKLGRATRALSKQEKAEVWNVIDLGDRHQKELSPEQLATAGFNEKQLAFFKEHREVMDYAFEKLNKAREVAGKKPIDKRVAYAAMRSTGDFRKLVYEGDSVVGIIGSNYRMRLNDLTKQMEAKGLRVGEERYYGGQRDRRGSANDAFMSAVEWIAENDSRAQNFLDVLDDIRTSEVYGYLNAKSHTKGKKGVFGMEGRKPWEDAQRNAEEGMQAQLDYAERAIKWGHISEAASQVHEVLRSPEINMPQAKAWSEKYLYNALGFNPSEMGRYFENGIASGFKSMGVGYSAARHTMAWSRRIVNANLLGLNPAFWTTQGIQPFQVMPGLKASLIAKGLKADFDFGTGYAYLGKGAITAMKERLGGGNAFDKAAYKYARENHVYGSDLVEHSNRASKDLTYAFDKVSNFMTGNLENATRRAVFFGIAHMLKENGMSAKNGLFEAAHTLTDQQMVNYSAVERPQMYNTLGPIGDLAVNLQNYKHNSLSRLSMFARQIAEDKSARPLLADLGATVAVAGIIGIMGYEEADALYKFITQKLGKPDSLSSRIIRMSEDAGNWMNKKTGQKEDTVGDMRHLISHGGFSMLGVDMSKRLGMSNLLPNDTNEFLFPGGNKLGAMAEKTYTFATNPTSMNAKKMAREFVPGAGAGSMDREWFSKEIGNNEVASNRETLQGQVRRTPLDKKWKSAGFTGIHESVEKTKVWELKSVKQAFQEMRKKPLNNMRDSIYETGKIDPKDVQAYIKADGDVNTIEADISRYITEQSMDAKSRELLRAMASESVANMKQAQRYMEMFRK